MGGAVGTFQKEYDVIIRGEGEGPVMMQAFVKRKKSTRTLKGTFPSMILVNFGS